MRTLRELDGEEGGKRLFHFYPSAQDIVNTELNSVNAAGFQSYTDSHDRDNPTKWWGPGITSYAGCVEAARKGWPEGTQAMRENLGALPIPELPSMRRKRKWSDAGDEVDIHRVNSGRVDRAWRRMSRVQALSTTATHVTVAVDVTTNWKMSVEAAMWRGLAAAAIAEACVMSGRQVRVITTQAMKENCPAYDSQHIAVEVKGYHQEMSTDVMMTFTALPGFVRGFCFRAMSTVGKDGDCNYEDYGSYGSIMDFDRELLEDGSEMIWIGRQNTSLKDAKRVCTQSIEALNRRSGL